MNKNFYMMKYEILHIQKVVEQIHELLKKRMYNDCVIINW